MAIGYLQDGFDYFIPHTNEPQAQTCCNKMSSQRRYPMLGWAVTFLVIAIVAGIFGFTGVAGAATNIAWILFVLFLILFVVSLVMGKRPG